jgi:transcriptional regulator GlxA family with amidase domain
MADGMTDREVRRSLAAHARAAARKHRVPDALTEAFVSAIASTGESRCTVAAVASYCGVSRTTIARVLAANGVASPSALLTAVRVDAIGGVLEELRISQNVLALFLGFNAGSALGHLLRRKRRLHEVVTEARASTGSTGAHGNTNVCRPGP